MEDKEYIFGKHPVEEFLARTPKRIQKIFMKEGIEPRFGSSIKALAKKYKISVVEVDLKKLALLSEGEQHQGVVALVSPTPMFDLKEWIAKIKIENNPCVVLMDELEDPHNVGAIIRSAAGFGASAILLAKHRQSPITGVVTKASAGTIDRVPLVRIGNINDENVKLKEKGVWILGLDGDGDRSLFEIDMKMPVCIVVGGEGKGIREKTLDNCDIKVRIPMENKVESFNASVSAALVLYEWRKQNK